MSEYFDRCLKKSQAQKTPAVPATAPFIAGNDGALSDRDIAANMLAQAKRMENEPKAMVAEAARMKKDAEKMDPYVTAKAVPKIAPVIESAPPVKVKRTRGPNKPKTVVADATHG